MSLRNNWSLAFMVGALNSLVTIGVAGGAEDMMDVREFKSEQANLVGTHVKVRGGAMCNGTVCVLFDAKMGNGIGFDVQNLSSEDLAKLAGCDAAPCLAIVEGVVSGDRIQAASISREH